MSGTDSGNDRPVGAGDGIAEPGELADPLSAHLQHGVAVLWLQAEERDGIAKLVVI